MSDNTPFKYKTSFHINSKVKLFGLEGWQVLVLGCILVFSFLIKWILPIILIIPVAIIVSYINSELKKGNPSPIESFFLKSSTKKKVIDNENVFSSISELDNPNENY